MSLTRLIALTGTMVALSLASTASAATLTHTTSNLNLRAGPGTNYPVRTIIPKGAEIDVHSCGHEWCYTSWVEHQGYVSRDYLLHHVAGELRVITHVTNVTYHSIY